MRRHLRDIGNSLAAMAVGRRLSEPDLETLIAHAGGSVIIDLVHPEAIHSTGGKLALEMTRVASTWLANRLQQIGRDIRELTHARVVIAYRTDIVSTDRLRFAKADLTARAELELPPFEHVSPTAKRTVWHRRVLAPAA